VAQRRKRAEHLLAASAPRWLIVERMAELGCHERTTDRYLQKIREDWHAQQLLSSEEWREQRVARLSYLARKLERVKAYSPMMRAETLLNDVLGVAAPVQVRHSGAVLVGQVEMTAALKLLSDEQLAAFKAAAQALPALPVPGEGQNKGSGGGTPPGAAQGP